MFRLISSQSGSLTNVSELSSTLGLSAATVKNYLWYFQKTYIMKKVLPFHANIRKEITNASVFHISDLGMKNFGTGDFGHIFRSRIRHPFYELMISDFNL